MSTILLTGFEPFGEFQSNPSQQVAERMDGETVAGAKVIGLTLPVAFGEDTERAFGAIADHHPILVMSLGLRAGAACLEVERFGVNLKAEAGAEAQTPIIADGFAALAVTLDAEWAARAIRDGAGVPARAHGYAGSFVCNHILYQTLHYAQQWSLSCKVGFIHLPLSCEQAINEHRMHQPSLPLELMTHGVRAALEAALYDSGNG